jgi:hypothetical protein
VRRWIAIVIALSACFGKPGFRGGGDDGPGDDAGVDAAYPTAFGPWQQRVPVPIGVTGANDSGPSVSRDGRELYFYSDRDPGGGMPNLPRLWVARRDDTSLPFGDPMWLGLPGREYDPTIMSDGLDLYFFDSSNSIQKLHRGNRTAAWMPDGTIDIPATHPFGVGNHGLSMVAGSMPPLDPSSEIIEFVRASISAPWLTATPKTQVAHIPGHRGDYTPCLSTDGLELFWEHEESDGTVRLWSSRRDSADAMFPPGAQLVIPGVTSSAHGDPEISADGTELYFSDRSGAETRIFETRSDTLSHRPRTTRSSRALDEPG